MRLAMIQMSNSGSVEKNMEKSLHAIAEAAEKGAELVLFPEVQLTEFFPQYLGRDVSSYSVSIEDEIVKKFCDACKKHQIMAVPNLYLRSKWYIRCEYSDRPQWRSHRNTENGACCAGRAVL